MSSQAEITEENRLTRLQEILASGAVREATRLLRSLAPAEIAHLLESLPVAEREIVWNLVDEEHDGQILLLVTEEVRSQLIRHMDAEELLAATENLDLDDLADLVQQMPAAITAQVMDALDDQRRHRLQAVLSYPEDTAGGLMNTDTVTVRPEVTLDVV
ncbi:MAG: magnesium transporter, partial [Gammaproteobacteria bacterium]|nr:magnesium transporter [Gammaproteobacteria bacterium]